MTEVDPGSRVSAEAGWMLSLGGFQRGRSSPEGGEEAWKEGASDHFGQGPALRWGQAVRDSEIPAPLQVPPPQEPC